MNNSSGIDKVSFGTINNNGDSGSGLLNRNQVTEVYCVMCNGQLISTLISVSA